ncbi:MAG: hypothetical protein WA999_07885, partial [Spirulinaceae cyanobacterium]
KKIFIEAIFSNNLKRLKNTFANPFLRAHLFYLIHNIILREKNIADRQSHLAIPLTIYHHNQNELMGIGGHCF